MKYENLKWTVNFHDHSGGITELNESKVLDSDEIVDLEMFVPRVGEHIVAGDYSPDIEDEKCYKVKQIFWNLQRKDIDVYVNEVDKETYPMFRNND